MKSMTDLDFEGRIIQLYPTDTVSKWGRILHVTEEGIVVKITEVSMVGGSVVHGGAQIARGDIQFYNWTKLTFRLENGGCP